MRQHPLSFSLVSFAYNEEQLLESAVRGWTAELRALGHEFEIILVDDGSTDRTGPMADELAAEIPELTVVRHPVNRGTGHAVRTGIAHTTKSVVFWNDVDGHFDLSDMSKVLPFLEDPEIDVLVAFKHDTLRSKRPLSWLKSRVNFHLIRALFLFNIRDFQFVQFYPGRFIREGIELESHSSFVPPECLIKARAAGLEIRHVQLRYHSRVVPIHRGVPKTARTLSRAVTDITSFWGRWVLGGGRRRAREHWARTVDVDPSCRR